MENDLRDDNNNSTSKMNSPAIYQIKVQGKLSSSWSDSLSGMNITNYKQDGNVTTLVGKLRDQAALAGILQTLYELRFPILLVEYKE
jgi:hypothetical protein